MNNGSLVIGVNGVSLIGNAITLTGSATFGGSNILNVDGQIGGSGSLTDSNTAKVILGNINSYTGGTNVTAGMLQLGGFGNDLIGSGPLTLNDGTTFEASFGGALNNAITLNGISTIIGGFLQNPNLTLSGVISGAGGFSTWGTLILTGNNTYSGTTTVISEGFLVVNGSQPSSAIVLMPNDGFGALLSGTGTVGPVTVNVTANSASNIHPGQTSSRDLPGILTTGNVQFNGGTLRIEADGPAAGAGYSQLQVNGTVSLGQGVATLVELSTTKFSPGTRLRIIENLGTMPVSGFFAGLPEGSIFTDSNGNRFQITYHGGNGNDVVLIAIPRTDDIAGRVQQSGDWWVAVSNGSKAFTNSLWGTWDPTRTWVDVLTGDFNGDGRTDYVARDQQTGQVWVALSNGSSFTTTLWTTWAPNVTWVDVRVGDFTGDGKDDIAGRVKESGDWWVAQSTGSSFTNTLWGKWYSAATFVDTQVGDFTGDGKADIASRDLASGAWWVAVSNGSSFTTTSWAMWDPSVTWVDVRVGDFNGDGKADIAGRDQAHGAWWVALSSGSSFSTTLWTVWDPTVSWVDVRVGDLSGDGKADLVGRIAQNGQIWVSLSSGSSFTNNLWATWDPSVTWVDVQVGDFNGDGKADIAGRDLAQGAWWVGLSNGSTAFTTMLWTTWDPGVTWVDVDKGRST